MCGICGIYQKNGKTKELEETILRMNQFQRNRGPDGEGIFIGKGRGVSRRTLIGLGHRRLSIIDLSRAGKQPMIWRKPDRKEQIVISYNGEIYNFLELKKDLEKKGCQFKTQTDTEVILALYAKYGEQSFSRLRGMFAFALWDEERQKIFLVKDRYGIKPLYYYADSEKLIFASTVKAIGKSGLIPFKKNQKALIGFLLFGSVPLPLTTIENVLAIPAGHYLVREVGGNQKLIKYYEPLEFFEKKSDGKNAVQNIRCFLENSVKLHLISDAPLGVFLSGGLDSSFLSILSAKQKKEPLVTLSVDFEEKEFSEKSYQRLIAEKIKSNHCEIKVTRRHFSDSFEEIFEAMDQPTVDGVNSFFIAKAARTVGLKAVLSGLGSDEIFCGYPSFRRAAFLKKIQKLPGFLKIPLNLFSLFGDRYAKLSYFANDDILSFYLGVRGLFIPEETARILDINLSEVKSFLNDFWQSEYCEIARLRHLSPIDLLSYLELKFYLQNQLFKDTDSMAMYHSVEVRVPFLDHQLVEYVSSLPSVLKLNDNLNKPLLIEAVRDLVPEKILSRQKMGFTFPFAKWFQELVKERDKRFAVSDLRFVQSHWSRFWAKLVLDKFIS